ncbi:MAG: hypothetical protein DRP02_02240 [Candidatus Gerdarchaeota archaeon]|nr:MAG: hypothetical protein DRP02_02240 [Candidatus Gerdarchaeota archaeon]
MDKGKIGYMKDGQKVFIERKLDDGYLIRKYCVYYDYDGNEEEELLNEVLFVKELLKTPPLEKYEADISTKRREVSVLKEEILKLKQEKVVVAGEIKKLSEQKTDVNKGVIVLDDICKKEMIAISRDGGINNVKDFDLYKERYSIKKVWGGGLIFSKDGGQGSSYDQDYTVFFADQVEKIVDHLIELVERKDGFFGVCYGLCDFSRIPTKYKTKRLLQKKKEFEIKENKKAIKSNEYNLSDAKKRVEQLEKQKIKLSNFNS